MLQCYIDPVSRSKFYSKAELSQYLETVKCNNGTPKEKEIDTGSISNSAVKIDESPEWLPHGWIMEVKTKKNGSQYKCYIDPATGHKCYSKPELSRYLKGVKCNSGKTKEDIGSISNVVDEILSLEGLPPGWIKAIRTRKYGNGIKKDPYYFDPESGYMFRSTLDAKRYLDTGDIATCKIKPQKRDNNDMVAPKNDDIWCYIDPATGSKFYSKAELSKYRETVQCDSGTAKEKEIDIGSISNSAVKIDESPEWLPRGWIMEVKTKKSGSQYKCYIDPATGYKCYSKPALSRYLKGFKCNSGKAKEDIGCIINHDLGGSTGEESSLKPDVSQISKDVVDKTLSLEGLPPGWIKEIRKRKYASGTKKDPYYIDPESGYMFRSTLDALRYLKTGGIATCKMKPKRMDVNDMVLKHEDICAPSAVGGKKRKHSTSKRRLFEGKERSGSSGLAAFEAKSSKERRTNGFKRKHGLTVSENGSASTPATDIFPEETLPQNVMEENSKKKTWIGSRNSMERGLRRTSKRLAGIKPEIQDKLESSESALAAARKSTEIEANPSPTLVLDGAANRVPELVTELEAETTKGHASIDKEAVLDIEPSIENKRPVDISQVSLGMQTTEKQDEGKPESQDSRGLYSLGDSWSDPCLDFAFKTLTGAIPVEDNPIQGHLQQQPDPSSIQEEGCFGLPESGMPSFFQNDVPAQVDSPEKRVPPLNPAFVPQGNANIPGCSWLRPQQPSLDPGTSNIRQG
ncbi:unnamed protein product [Ilex paraguariensis]|uniref:MBD domain-containing protein n=1 Tax=Ilex paraguariensis TaxID=185542 RepID=A0ABC8RA40_9AQUA